MHYEKNLMSMIQYKYDANILMMHVQLTPLNDKYMYIQSLHNKYGKYVLYDEKCKK